MINSEKILKTYKVHKVDQPIDISGRGLDQAWEKAEELSDFSYPWRKESAPSTRFKALWDDTHFYFLYHAEDSDILFKQELWGEQEVVNSDRVEIFFKADDKMHPYYSLEMDALARVLDTEGRYHRNIDFDWSWPKGELILQASMNKQGYIVEGKISFASLRALGMYKDDHILKAGLYRGEYTIGAEKEPVVKWISWVHPDSETPDFHIPSSFGILKLVNP